MRFTRPFTPGHRERRIRGAIAEVEKRRSAASLAVLLLNTRGGPLGEIASLRGKRAAYMETLDILHALLDDTKIPVRYHPIDEVA